MLRKGILWVAVSLLTVVLLLGLAGVLALYSETGTRWALHQLQALKAETLRIEGVSGSLAGGIDIATLEYNDDKTELKVSDASIRLTLRSLLRRELLVDSISIDQINVTTRGGATDDSAGKFAIPSLPIDIVLAAARINKITYRGATVEIIDDVNASIAWRSDQVTISGLQVFTRDTLIQGEGQLQLSEAFPLSAQISWEMQREISLRGKASVTGTLSRLEIHHELLEPYRVISDGHVDTTPPLRFELTNTSAAIDYTVSQRTLQLRDAVVSVAGEIDDYKVSWQSAATTSGMPLQGIAGTAQGSTQGLAIEKFNVLLDQGSVTGTGQLNWLPQPDWQLNIDLRNIDPGQLQADWPGELNGTMSFSGRLAESGLIYDLRDISVAGSLKQQTVSMSGRLQGDTQGLRAEGLELRLDRSRINSNGQLNWASELQWDFAAEFFNLDPSVVLADWPGKLNGSLGIKGRLADDKLEYQLDNIRGSGELRGQQIEVLGSIKQSANNLQLDRVRVSSGVNRVVLSGSIGQQLAITYDADITDLGSFGQGYTGMVKGAGRLGGTLSAPQVDMQLTGRDLRVADYAVGSIDINGQLLPGKTAAELVLSARKLEISGRPIDSVDATLSGQIDDHLITLQAGADKRSFSLSLAGGWQEQQWRGQLADSSLDFGPHGQWQQKNSAALSFDTEQMQLGQLCLQQDLAAACIEGVLGSEKINAIIKIDQVSLSPITAFLPSGVRAKGVGAAEIILSGSPQEPLANFRLSSSSIVMHYQYSDDDEVVDTTLRDLLLTGKADRTNLNVELKVSGSEISALNFTAQLSNWRDKSPGVMAKLNASIPDVAFLSMLSTDVSGWSGSAAADFAVSGLLAAPQLAGFIRLENGSVELREAGITLQQVDIVARPAGAGRLGVTASAVSGGGKIVLDGLVTLDANAQWPVSGTIRGENFTAVQLTGLDVVVSPDITISGVASNLQLRGKVVAPRAMVEIRELPDQTVQVSSDVVIKGAENLRQKPVMQIDTEIEVVLGDNVNFNGFGLATSLAGAIDLKMPPDLPATGRGVVKIKSGKYQSYGQDLSIENGRLIFTGALDDPTLDVEASRQIGDVKVGVRISGTGQSPEARLFSVPTMAEAEALSYLIIGRPLAAATNAEGAQLKNSAILAGLKQALPITDQIGRAVGLDELGLDTSSTDTGAIMAGKQVGSDLYVRFSFGLFDRIGALLLRYSLNQHVSLEARSAEDQSLDIIYTRGRD